MSVRLLITRFGTVCTVLAIFGSSASQLAAQGACVRPAAKSSYQRAPVVLKQTSGFPCTIEVVPTGVVLKRVPGRVDNIGRRVARGPDERFYTAIPTEGAISVWDRDGTFLSNLGRDGRGPGEFAKGEKTIAVDQTGRLFVHDNSLRWSVFDPNLRFIAAISSVTMGAGSSQAYALLDDGSFLTSSARPVGAFRIYETGGAVSPNPRLIRAFGPKLPKGSERRPVAYAGGKSFWVGPMTGHKFEYTLQQWSTDGRLLRTIRRDVPWLRDDVVDSQELGVQPGMRIHADGTGLLFVSLGVPLTAYGKLTPLERRQRDEGGAADRAMRSYFEVIDVNAEVVLASIGPLSTSQFERQVLDSFFPRSREGYRSSEDADGFRTMRIVEVMLKNNANRLR